MGRAQAWSAAFRASVFMSPVVLTDSYGHAGHAGATCVSCHTCGKTGLNSVNRKAGSVANQEPQIVFGFSTHPPTS